MDSQYNNLSEQYASKSDGYYETERSEMLPFIPQDALSVLDVGCSSGGFGKLIKDMLPGAEVWGIEPSEDFAAIAKTKLDNAICSTFELGMPELAGKTFDCIIFNDVLEHLVNPEQALLDSKEYLGETGLVVASIPNILFFYQILEILVEQDWKYRDEGILDNTHLRFFTKKSIIRMFEACGYEIVKIRGINASFGLKYKTMNLLTLGFLRDWKYVQFAVEARVAIKR